mmetsp:Transcript_64905/g.167040  ORF Transcript_64905/g.167040 Transcript_64905/m.167040 type:complete len:136 (-) Transcript_64905:109-516(-)
MARGSVLAAVCAVAALCFCSQAFVPAPSTQSLRGEAALVAAAGAAGVVAQPGAAEAFVYNGKEYFDVTFGISPLAWGFAAFAIIFYGALIKNAAQKYNKPFGTNTVIGGAPKPPKMGGKFVGMEVENSAESYKAV